LMLFNDFVFKVSHLFSMWTGIKFSLLTLCRTPGNVMAQDVLPDAEGVVDI
jgi:hypothetical protein